MKDAWCNVEIMSIVLNVTQIDADSSQIIDILNIWRQRPNCSRLCIHESCVNSVNSVQFPGKLTKTKQKLGLYHSPDGRNVGRGGHDEGHRVSVLRGGSLKCP